MTYLYIITFLVLITSQLRLSRDLSFEHDNESFIKRSLNSYRQSTDETVSVVKASRLKKEVAVVSKMQTKHELLNQGETKADKEVKEKQDATVHKQNIPEEIDGAKKTAGDIDKIKRDEKLPEKKTQKESTNNAKKVNGNLVINKDKPAEKKAPVLRQAKYTNPYLQIVPNLNIANNPEPKDLLWQKVMDNGTFLIFSAVMDYIYGQPYVRALAINGNYFMPKFYCELTYNNTDVVTTTGKMWMLPDHHEMTYKTVFLYCPLPDDDIPVYLSIIPIYGPVRLHRLPVLYHPQEKRNFTVCLSPLFFNRSIEFELVQWFEINRILGVDLFMVYVFSNHPRTDEILHHYVNEGWVQVIPWKLPEHTDLHYYGQNAAVNDCMMRNFKISRYMVNIDIDELIVPRKGMTTLNELMLKLPKNFCEYSFRSTFMAEETKAVYDGKQKARELNLYFLLRIARRAYIFDKAVRSKYIVNTTCIDTVGIHYCWKYKNGTIDTERFYVPPRDALMFHFRSEPVMKEGKEIEEKAVYKYYKQLIQNAKARWDKINTERQEAKKTAKQNIKGK